MSIKFIRRLSLGVLAAGLAVTAQAATPTYGVVDRIKAPDGGFDFVSFDPHLGRIYVSRADGALALDVASGVVTPQLAPAQHSHAVAVVDDGARILITDSVSNSAHLADARSGALVADIPTGQKPDAAMVDPASGLALVMNGRGGDITLIDPAAQKAVGVITVGGAPESAVADGRGKVFVNIEDQNQIAVLDTRARTLTGHYALPGCEGPTGLAYASEAGVLIAACANKVAKVIRASDGKDLATLAIGAGPDQIAYDPVRRLAFIPCGRDGVMEVVAVRGPNDVAIVQTVKTQLGARTGAVDPASGKVYLPTATYVASAAGGKPAPQPGTFVILVVAPGA